MDHKKKTHEKTPVSTFTLFMFSNTEVQNIPASRI